MYDSKIPAAVFEIADEWISITVACTVFVTEEETNPLVFIYCTKIWWFIQIQTFKYQFAITSVHGHSAVLYKNSYIHIVDVEYNNIVCVFDGGGGATRERSPAYGLEGPGQEIFEYTENLVAVWRRFVLGLSGRKRHRSTGRTKNRTRRPPQE